MQSDPQISTCVTLQRHFRLGRHINTIYSSQCVLAEYVLALNSQYFYLNIGQTILGREQILVVLQGDSSKINVPKLTNF